MISPALYKSQSYKIRSNSTKVRVGLTIPIFDYFLDRTETGTISAIYIFKFIVYTHVFAIEQALFCEGVACSSDYVFTHARVTTAAELKQSAVKQ